VLAVRAPHTNRVGVLEGQLSNYYKMAARQQGITGENLLCLLVDKSRESALAETYQAYVDLVERAAGLVHVEVVSAVPLTPELQQALKSKIESSLHKTVELAMTVDEDVLGGLKLRIGGRVADASVRYRLEKLRESLISPMASMEGSVEAAS